jgi:hypothetical protein
MAQNSIAREVTFEAETDAAISLELDLDRRVDRSPLDSPRYVTGATQRAGTVGVRAPEPVACAYCGASAWATDRTGACCVQCGAPVGATLPPAAPIVPASSSIGAAVADGMTSIPFAFWKRVPAYAFLALVLGNGCRCRGLSTMTNVSLAVLVVVGLAGVVLSLQRSP